MPKILTFPQPDPEPQPVRVSIRGTCNRLIQVSEGGEDEDIEKLCHDAAMIIYALQSQEWGQ